MKTFLMAFDQAKLQVQEWALDGKINNPEQGKALLRIRFYIEFEYLKSFNKELRNILTFNNISGCGN